MAPKLTKLDGQCQFAPRNPVVPLRVDQSKKTESSAQRPEADNTERGGLAHEKTRFFAEWKTFLEEVVDHPDLSLRQHYKNLGISMDKGTRLKRQLLENELIRETKSGKALQVTLTEKGIAFCNAQRK